MMNRPATLAQAMQKANDIEMARQTANLGNPAPHRNPAPQRYFRGRNRNRSGRFVTGRMSGQRQSANASNIATPPISSDQCHRCHGYGHWASQCPTPAVRGRRGGRRGRHGTPRGNSRGRGRGQVGAAALVAEPSEAEGAALQSAPDAPSESQTQGN